MPLAGGTPTWLDPKHAAEHCSVSPETIRRAAREGALQSVRIGGRFRFRVLWLDAWMEREGRHDPDGPLHSVASSRNAS